MKALLFTLTCCIVSINAFSFDNSTDIAAKKYIEQHKQLAIDEMCRSAIPASIRLAQAMLASNYGSAPTVAKSNNHFGLECSKDWTGPTVYIQGKCYRQYANAEAAFHNHSTLFLDNPQYDALFKLHPLDYINWAVGVKKAGYSAEPDYANQLVAIIDRYQLFQYDERSAVKCPLIYCLNLKLKPEPVIVPNGGAHKALDEYGNIISPQQSTAKPTIPQSGTNNIGEFDKILCPLPKKQNPALARKKPMNSTWDMQHENVAPSTPSYSATPPQKPLLLESHPGTSPSPYSKPEVAAVTTPEPSTPPVDIVNVEDIVGGGMVKQRIEYINRVKVVRFPVEIQPLEIARMYGYSHTDILKNNEVKYGATFPARTPIYLEPKRQKTEADIDVHVVKEGETIWTIAQEYGVWASKLRERNSILKDAEPVAGEVIYLRSNAREVPKTHYPDQAQNSTKMMTYTPKAKNYIPASPFGKSYAYKVKAGDTLQAISKEYGIPVWQIMRDNKMDSDLIYIGQSLKIIKE